jgi:hypothetical protein
MDKRISTMSEVFFGIRHVKAFVLEMFYKKHNIFFVGRGKKGSLDFLKKQFYF